MTAPGGGPITARAFAGAIDDPARFRRLRGGGASLGPATRRHRCGETGRNGSITEQGDPRLRTPLCGAAGVVITRMRADVALAGPARGAAARSSSREARARPASPRRIASP
jgi:transposase